MTHQETWNVYQWDGSLGDPEGDGLDDYLKSARPGPEFPFTVVRRCIRCDGFMTDIAAYARVSDERATSCHHCRGDVRCASGKHHIQPGATCWTCEVFRDR